MKTKIFTLLFAAMVSIGTMYATIYSGTCGEHVHWNLDSSTRHSSVTGTGKMYDYPLGDQFSPWRQHWDSIKTIAIHEGITYIGKEAFHSCALVTSVTLPNTIDTIGARVFEDCQALTSITIPNSVAELGEYAFDDCFALTSVTLSENITKINQSTFASCTALTSINIPKGVTDIGLLAFGYCSSLPSLTIPNSVTTIDRYAFRGCQNLDSITIPSNVATIGEKAFFECPLLKTVTINSNEVALHTSFYSPLADIFGGQVEKYVIGEGVTDIGYYAFRDGSLITSIVLPSTLNKIYEYAFASCSALKTLRCDALTPPTLVHDVFGNVDKSVCTLYVPAKSLELYKAADQWKDFFNILPVGIITSIGEIEDFNSPEHKILIDGQIYIKSSNKTYTITGQEVK